MIRGNGIFIACVVGLLTSGMASAADPPDTASVLGKVHRSNQKEIEMGKMAQKHGVSKDVKAFGKDLVKDHSAADKKVAKLAKEEKVDLAANTPAAESHDMKETGAGFDAAFAKDMLEDHKKDVAEVTAARDATSDAKLKALLSDILPVLQKHQDTAQKLVDQTANTKS
jgi:putative membrane protein